MGVDGSATHNSILLAFFPGAEHGSRVSHFIVEREIEYEPGWKLISQSKPHSQIAFSFFFGSTLKYVMILVSIFFLQTTPNLLPSYRGPVVKIRTWDRSKSRKTCILEMGTDSELPESTNMASVLGAYHHVSISVKTLVTDLLTDTTFFGLCCCWIKYFHFQCKPVSYFKKKTYYLIEQLVETLISPSEKCEINNQQHTLTLQRSLRPNRQHLTWQ